MEEEAEPESIAVDIAEDVDIQDEMDAETAQGGPLCFMSCCWVLVEGEKLCRLHVLCAPSACCGFTQMMKPPRSAAIIVL